jgi:hypothetical protein
MFISPAQIERLKREAKQVARNSNLAHNQALDQKAADNGYANWSLLMKHNATASVVSPPPFRFVRTPAEMQLALRRVPEPRFGLRIYAARSLVDDICRSFVSAHNAVEFSIAYMECLLTVPRFKIYGATLVHWEMRCWLPYAAMPVHGNVRILVNRRYKPLGQMTNDQVDYAEFNHLHLELGQDQVAAVSQRQSSEGYFFNDRCPPWRSRKDAQAYLEQLRHIHSAMTGLPPGSHRRSVMLAG